MRIVLAADIFPPDSGGPASYVVHLANTLTDRGESVQIVSLNKDSDTSVVTCPVHRVKSGHKLLRYAQYFLHIFRVARTADIIYAMGPVNAGFPALLVAKLLRKKLVVKVVGDYAWEQYQHQNSYQEYQSLFGIDAFQKKASGFLHGIQFLRYVERFVVRRAHRVIVPSKYLKGIVEGWGAKADQVSVVYNAVSFADIKPENKPDGEQWIVSVARLMPWKGMDTLISLMLVLRNMHPNLQLYIIGGGPMLESLRAQVAELQLESVVTLTGALPRRETLAHIAAADVFVLNSAYEGLSHVLLEALYLDTPVVASNAGGNPELLSDGLFTYNDAEDMQRAITRALEGNVSQQIDATQFSFDTMIAETTSILSTVCQH